jgi:hypothetical protein
MAVAHAAPPKNHEKLFPRPASGERVANPAKRENRVRRSFSERKLNGKWGPFDI